MVPFISQATDDARVTSITMTSQSDTTPAAAATYELTLVTSATITSNEVVNFVVNDGLSVDQTFDFTNTTFTSSTISGTGSAVAYSFFYSITLSSDLAAGTHTITLTDVMNGPSDGSDFYWGANSVALAPNVAVTPDQTPFALGTVSGEPTLIVFGGNIAVSWAAREDAETYGVIISEDENNNDEEVIEVGEGLNYLLSDLDPETTYYIDVVAYDSDGVQFPVAYLEGSTTTEKSIKNTRYSKPTVPKSKIKSTAATVKWTVGDDVDYIDSFSVRLKKGKKTVATYNGIPSDKLQKKLKDLKIESTYTVQVRATYSTDETTKWSKAISFKTKSE